MKYRNENGEITNYDLEILQKNEEPFALVISEAKGYNQPEISKELCLKAANIVADSYAVNNGDLTVFAEKRNGNFTELSVSISTPHRNPVSQVKGEGKEVSENKVDLFREVAGQVTQSRENLGKDVLAEESFSHDLREEAKNMSEPANQDDRIKPKK